MPPTNTVGDKVLCIYLLLTVFFFVASLCQGAVPKGNATKEYMESLQLKPGEVIYKCPKCCSIKPERAHHCRSVLALPWFIMKKKKKKMVVVTSISAAKTDVFFSLLCTVFVKDASRRWITTVPGSITVWEKRIRDFSFYSQ